MVMLTMTKLASDLAIIEPHFPKAGRGPARQDDRRILNCIFYILRTGAPWRDLPERNGPRTTVYNRYSRWGQRSIWKGIFDASQSLMVCPFAFSGECEFILAATSEQPNWLGESTADGQL